MTNAIRLLPSVRPSELFDRRVISRRQSMEIGWRRFSYGRREFNGGVSLSQETSRYFRCHPYAWFWFSILAFMAVTAISQPTQETVIPSGLAVYAWSGFHRVSVK